MEREYISLYDTCIAMSAADVRFMVTNVLLSQRLELLFHTVASFV